MYIFCAIVAVIVCLLAFCKDKTSYEQKYNARELKSFDSPEAAAFRKREAELWTEQVLRNLERSLIKK